MIQALWDRYYNPAYDRAWADYEAGLIDADAAVERCHVAWMRANERIRRETGAVLTP